MIEEVVTVSDVSSNKQNDTDVFRAEDIVPPYNKKSHPGQDLQETEANEKKVASSQNEPKQPLEDTTSMITGAAQKASEIPKFDLAEQIMAEQRKITSVKRKAPGKPQPPFLLSQKARGQDGAAGKTTKAPDQLPQAKSIGYTIKQPLTLSEQKQIIAEIVARDIEKLYRGEASSLRNW